MHFLQLELPLLLLTVPILDSEERNIQCLVVALENNNECIALIVSCLLLLSYVYIKQY